jgi:hypothetical protein
MENGRLTPGFTFTHPASKELLLVRWLNFRLFARIIADLRRLVDGRPQTVQMYRQTATGDWRLEIGDWSTNL